MVCHLAPGPPDCDPALGQYVYRLFQNTSLVVTIALFDFLTTIKVSLTEPAWTGFGVEAYFCPGLLSFLLPDIALQPAPRTQWRCLQKDSCAQGELKRGSEGLRSDHDKKPLPLEVRVTTRSC